MTNKRIVVVGGGAAGILAASRAAMDGTEVYLIEKNEKLGKKLFITGKGRCNVTNSAAISEFFSHIPTNPKFLYRALHGFTNEDLMALLEDTGLQLKTERGGRVFPESDKSSDVIRALSRILGKAGAKVALKTSVREIIVKEGKVCGVKLDKGNLPCDAVILATGGFSYPSTGSSGEGHQMAVLLGHHTTKIYPALIPLLTPNIPEMRKLKGLALKNIALTYRENGKTLYTEQGEMEFTAYGFTGPLILSASTRIVDRDFKKAEISIDLKPALPEEKLEARILRDFSENQNAKMKDVLRKLFPKQLISVVLSRANISGEKQVNAITKQERQQLIRITKGLTFPVCGTRPIGEAIITRGGIPVSEINPATMQSKQIAGLYFAGEMIDVDAETGGYNLQIAFSTGWLAGKNAAESLLNA